jgi:hypothetical protein
MPQRMRLNYKAIETVCPSIHPGFCETNRGQSRNFKIHIVEKSFCISGRLDQFAGQAEFAISAGEIGFGFNCAKA